MIALSRTHVFWIGKTQPIQIFEYLVFAGSTVVYSSGTAL